MSIFIKVVAGSMIAVVLSLTISKQKDLSILITLTACIMTVIAAITYLVPVVNFFKRLQSIVSLNSELISALLKATGIGILSEITCLICEDAGQASLSKALKILSSSIMLFLCIPLFSELMDLINEILVGV